MPTNPPESMQHHLRQLRRTSFVRALIARGQIDEDAVVSSDEIRAQLFGISPDDTDTDTDVVDARG
ncbi:hypothetical protein [Streptomyces monashensis]|uniref:Uncharacterized protein n=1 Tax=Streptomyces monashensis TaxID=1678012 RepID=A0A1S2QJN4_9ACTN|nr:hypothetical protein [Streptomyces monashensis]OIK06352.1 hypothetical protein BIV23_08145 [Streptomyces monashensis]